LHGRLLDECLRLAVQVLRLGHRGSGHGSQQHRSHDELLARSRGCVQIVDVEVGVDAIMGLPAQLTRAFTAREVSPTMEARNSHTARYSSAKLTLELARLG
jgi:hypothetical protein